MSILQSVLTVLLSLFGSSVASVYVTHKLAASEKRRELLQQKLERLYLSGIDHYHMLIASITMSAAYHSGKLNKSVISEHFDKNNEKNGEAVNNLTMICNVYFPELVNRLKEIEDVREAVANSGLRTAIHGDPPDRGRGSEVLAQLSRAKSAFDRFNSAIFETGKRINK
jgi:hypothetical protein